MYVAHTIRDENGKIIKEQSLVDHLRATAELAAAFAKPLHAQEWARAIGLCHDVGKSSDRGQHRMKDPEHTPKVDHATRGAQLVYNAGKPPAYMAMAYAVCGHHGHLPDGGDTVSPNAQNGTLMARMQKQVDSCEDFLKSWHIELPKAMPFQPCGDPAQAYYSMSFFTRVLHSCLVDADYLDTEAFLSPPKAPRGAFLQPPELMERLQRHMVQFAGKTGALNEARASILARCQSMAKEATGFFSLTVPTGGGKTLASLSFALRHAVQNGQKRVIYAIPYTSILEQTVDVFRKALGADQVVAHYADAFVDDADGKADREDDELHRMRLASENWDASVIVTTNVQLFESLYASKPSKCRKLHHLSGSVIVLDEAQLLPLPYLMPCLRALSELVRNCGATVVLMSATQPELGQFLPKDMPLREISQDILKTYTLLRRAAIHNEGETTLEQLAQRLCEQEQVLCIVNTRKKARTLYELLPEEGRYHLSTLMLPDDRRRVLREVRERLIAKLPCRLVATSLIEAGVDVDFPTGWREMSGLDSLLQAAGRVNREGLRSAQESVLHAFTLEGEKPHGEIGRRAAVAQVVFHDHADVTTPDAIRAYFNELYAVKGEQALDQNNVVASMSNRKLLFPYDTVAKSFRLIDDNTISVVIPTNSQEGKELRSRLISGEADRSLLRQAGASSISVYERDAQALVKSLRATPIGEDGSMLLLTDEGGYDPDVGLDISLDVGRAVIL